MNSVTIMVPWLPIVGAIGAMSGFLLIRQIMRAITSSHRRRKGIRVAASIAQGEKERERSVAKQAEVRALFSPRWVVAYETCLKFRSRGTGIMDAHIVRGIWLRKWLSEQTELPALSCEAAGVLAGLLGERNSARWSEALTIVAPYFDTGHVPKSVPELDSSHCTADWNLCNELPKAWYNFWKELEDYPDRRSLFRKNLGKDGGGTPHPVFQTSLTPKQAGLLARALGGGNKYTAGYYAQDLVNCVVMKEESVPVKSSYCNCNVATCPKCLQQQRECPF